MNKETIFTIILAILLVALLIAMIFTVAKEPEREANRGIFKHPGNCPTCGKPLVKGIYGYQVPNFCWYCPTCP